MLAFFALSFPLPLELVQIFLPFRFRPQSGFLSCFSFLALTALFLFFADPLFHSPLALNLLRRLPNDDVASRENRFEVRLEKGRLLSVQTGRQL